MKIPAQLAFFEGDRMQFKMVEVTLQHVDVQPDGALLVGTLPNGTRVANFLPDNPLDPIPSRGSFMTTDAVNAPAGQDLTSPAAQFWIARYLAATRYTVDPHGL